MDDNPFDDYDEEFTFISKKRKSFGHQNWENWLQEKQKDFTPLGNNGKRDDRESRNDTKHSRQIQSKGNRQGRSKLEWQQKQTPIVAGRIVNESPTKYEALISDDSSSSETEDCKKRRTDKNRSTSSKSAMIATNKILSDLRCKQNVGSSSEPRKCKSLIAAARPANAVSISDHISKLQLDFQLIKNHPKLGETVTPKRTFEAHTQTKSLGCTSSTDFIIHARKRRKSAPLPNESDIFHVDDHTPNQSPQKSPTPVFTEFKTPEKRTIVPDSDNEIRETTILEVESPCNLSPDVVRSFKRISKIRSKPVALRFVSPAKEDNENSAGSRLSGHISEDPSTPSLSQGNFGGLADQTPIAQWILKGKNVGTEVEISEFESPKKGVGGGRHASTANAVVSHTEFDSEHWTVVGGRGRRKHNLAEQMKLIVNRYESSVRMFPHDHRNGKFEEDLAMHLFIRMVCGREDRLIWTICHDLKEREDRCVIFKPAFRQEIMSGLLLKLYSPWKEINIPGFEAPVITCADFYKICQKPSNLGVTEEFISNLKASPVSSNLNNLKAAVPFTEELASTFSSLIPFSMKNPNTITKQVKHFRPSIDLDICVQKSWPSPFGSMVLVLDSDGIFSLLHVPAAKEELISTTVPGRFMKFKKLAIVSKVIINENASLFSVMSTLGSKQVFYYNLGLRADTEWDVELYLEIDFHRHPKADCQSKFIHEIQQLVNQKDERVTVECQVEKKLKDSIIVIDDASDRMKIDLVLSKFGNSCSDSRDFGVMFASLVPKKCVKIDFLRIFHGTPTIDEFSIVEEQRRLEGDL